MVMECPCRCHRDDIALLLDQEMAYDCIYLTYLHPVLLYFGLFIAVSTRFSIYSTASTNCSRRLDLLDLIVQQRILQMQLLAPDGPLFCNQHCLKDFLQWLPQITRTLCYLCSFRPSSSVYCHKLFPSCLYFILSKDRPILLRHFYSQQFESLLYNLDTVVFYVE